MGETVLITGGAGYIGSHAVIAFKDAGYTVVVMDDLSTGVRQSVPADVAFVHGNVGDSNAVGKLFEEYSVDGVIHFAGSLIVPESVTDPLKYYRNNTGVSRSLIESCVQFNVRRFIFSSTAAVYGESELVPVDEDVQTLPVNPYGLSKLMTEWILRDTAAAHDFSYVALRYFNVAGADPDGRVGQSSPGATNLIKVACSVATGEREKLEIFGDDYDTPDGTGVRDYIHVTDLARAHVDVYQGLVNGAGSSVLNCGYGRGYSVRDVITAVEGACGHQLCVDIRPRRLGDVGEMTANSNRIQENFGWRPRHDNLDFIVQTALDWEKTLARS